MENRIFFFFHPDEMAFERFFVRVKPDKIINRQWPEAAAGKYFLPFSPLKARAFKIKRLDSFPTSGFKKRIAHSPASFHIFSLPLFVRQKPNIFLKEPIP